MSWWSRTRQAYSERRANGRGRINSGGGGATIGLGRGIYDRVGDGYRQRRDPQKGIINRAWAGANAVPTATRNYLVEKQENFAKKYAAIFFIIVAFLINFVIETFWPQHGFFGMSLDFFKTRILGGDWFGIYNIFHFNIYFLVLVFVIINLRKGKPHTLKVWLTFILITYLLSSIPILNTYMGIRNVIELGMLLFAAFYLSLSKNITREDLIATVTLFWVFYNLLAFGVPWSIGGFIHFLFVIFFYLTFCMGKAFQEDKVQIKWWLLVIIIFDFVMPEFFANLYPDIPISTLPFLLFGVLVFAQSYQPSLLSMIGIIAIVTFYFLQFVAATGAFGEILPQRLADEEDVQNRRNLWSLSYWGGKLRGMINNSMFYGSGQDYYSSQVDENAKKKLGVYLEDIDRNPKFHYDNEKIVLDAVLTAENFASDEEYSYETINIQLSCAAYKNNEEYTKGKILPKDRYEIENYDVENIQCEFEPWQLEKGSYEIRFSAKFNFKTEAYLKRYFVSKKVIDSLRRKQLIKKDKDILKLNKISDTNPIAKNSVGPVEIKASERIPAIIKLDDRNVNKHLFGIELVNKWSGKIERVKQIQLFFPESVDIETCNPFHMELYPPPDERYEGYSLFQMPVTYNPRLENIEKSLQQKCWIVIEPGEINNILQPGDVTTRYFRMITDYIYRLEEKTDIRVREPEGFNIRILSIDGKPIESTSTIIKCTAKDEKDLKQVTFTLYKNDEKIGPRVRPCLENTCEETFEITLKKNDNLRCEASIEEETDGEKYTKTTSAYITVKNSPPKIESIELSPDPAAKGQNIICKVKVRDYDNDNINVRFDFEGLNIASTQKECDNTCQVEIPTDSAEKTTVLKCIATAYDGEDRTQDYATAKIDVPETITE